MSFSLLEIHIFEMCPMFSNHKKSNHIDQKIFKLQEIPDQMNESKTVQGQTDLDPSIVQRHCMSAADREQQRINGG